MKQEDELILQSFIVAVLSLSQPIDKELIKAINQIDRTVETDPDVYLKILMLVGSNDELGKHFNAALVAITRRRQQRYQEEVNSNRDEAKLTFISSMVGKILTMLKIR